MSITPTVFDAEMTELIGIALERGLKVYDNQQAGFPIKDAQTLRTDIQKDDIEKNLVIDHYVVKWTHDGDEVITCSCGEVFTSSNKYQTDGHALKIHRNHINVEQAKQRKLARGVMVSRAQSALG